MPSCFLLVRDPADLRASDQDIASRLETLGYTVTYRDDAASPPSSVDLVVVSSSVSASAMGDDYREYAGPIVSFDSDFDDNISMATSDSDDTGTQIDVVDDTHPLAVDAGLTNGTTAVLATSARLNYDNGTSAAAAVVATGVGVSGNAAVYTYSTGDVMAGGYVAAGPRVFLPFHFYSSPPDLNATGDALIDAAFAWADPQGGGAATAPTVDAGADASATVDAVWTRTAVEDDGGAAITAREWQVTAGPDQVTDVVGSAAALSWTPTSAGTYTLQYSATNSVGTGTDTVDVTAAAAPSAPVEPASEYATPATAAEQVTLVEASPLDVSVSVALVDAAGAQVDVIDVDDVVVRYRATEVPHRTVELTTSARLDWGRQRVTPLLTVTGGGFQETVPLGVFVLTDPQQVDAYTPATWNVGGYDLLYVLDQRLTAPVSHPKGQPVLFAVSSILAQHGFNSHRIDGSRGEDTLTKARSWTPDLDATYLSVINDLLEMVGYAPLWMTVEGLPASAPIVPATRRPPLWRYDAESETSIVDVDGRDVEQDATSAPNVWVFWRPDRDDPNYVVRNWNQGPSAIEARGGIAVRSDNDGPVEATSRADLEEIGDAVVASERDVQVRYIWSSTVNPYLAVRHGAVVEVVDRTYGVAGRFAVDGWELSAVGAVMSHDAHAVAGGVTDA